MKAFFLASDIASGHSCRLVRSWPWDSRVFRYLPQDRGVERERLGRIGEGWFDELILKEAWECGPDLVVYVSVPPHPLCMGGIPKAVTFRTLRSLAPVVHLCGDGGCAGWRGALLRYRDEARFDAQVTIDGCKDWPLRDEPGCWAALTPATFPAEIEVKPLAERKELLSLCCAVVGDDRTSLSALLRMAPSKAAGKHGYDKSYADYCRMLAGSRLTFNVPWCGSRSTKHVKGRVVEAGLAGCCLLEMRDAETARWFVAGEDYEEYEEDYSNARAAVEWLLDDLPAAQAMADGLRRKVLAYHNPAKFWGRVLEAVGIKA